VEAEGVRAHPVAAQEVAQEAAQEAGKGPSGWADSRQHLWGLLKEMLVDLVQTMQEQRVGVEPRLKVFQGA